MARKKKNDIIAFIVENGPNVIAQFVSSDEDWFIVQNAVGLAAEGDRLNMNPLIRYSAKDTDIQFPIAKISAIYQPTEGLTDEYIAVFIEETKTAIAAPVDTEEETQELETAEV